MYRRILIAITAIFVCTFTVFAQNSGTKYERYNRWMVGGELAANTGNQYGIGAKAVYGRQFSEILFLGVGFGLDMYVENQGDRSTTYTYPDGTEISMIYPPYAFNFLVPVYADLQINFSRKRAPFFAELKLGGAVDFDLERVRGTNITNTLDIRGGGVLLGAAIGKRFALRNEDEIDVTIGWDAIIWPWYINVPLSIGVRYGF